MTTITDSLSPLIGKELTTRVEECRRKKIPDTVIMEMCGYSYRSKDGKIQTQISKFYKALANALLKAPPIDQGRGRKKVSSKEKGSRPLECAVTKSAGISLSPKILGGKADVGDRFQVKFIKTQTGLKIILTQVSPSIEQIKKEAIAAEDKNIPISSSVIEPNFEDDDEYDNVA